MKKRGWIVLFLAFPLWMQGQSAREEIGKNPALDCAVPGFSFVDAGTKCT